MSDLIDEAVGIAKEMQLEVKNGTINLGPDSNGLSLRIYDRDNLVGFTLEGNVGGHNIYVVHDSDNYGRYNDTYRYLFDEAKRDAIHVLRQFIENKIKVKIVEKRKLFRQKEYVQVIIPDNEGKNKVYDNPVVNSACFY